MRNTRTGRASGRQGSRCSFYFRGSEGIGDQLRGPKLVVNLKECALGGSDPLHRRGGIEMFGAAKRRKLQPSPYRVCQSMINHLAHTAREVCGWLGSALPTDVSLIGQVA